VNGFQKAICKRLSRMPEDITSRVWLVI